MMMMKLYVNIRDTQQAYEKKVCSSEEKWKNFIVESGNEAQSSEQIRNEERNKEKVGGKKLR